MPRWHMPANANDQWSSKDKGRTRTWQALKAKAGNGSTRGWKPSSETTQCRKEGYRCWCSPQKVSIYLVWLFCMHFVDLCLYVVNLRDLHIRYTWHVFFNTRMPFHVFLMFFIPFVCLLLKLQTSSDHDFSISFFLEEESDIITESGSQKYFADFHALLTKPSCREVSASRRRIRR